MRNWGVTLACAVVLGCASGAQAQTQPIHAYVGSMHEHSGYSDGLPRSTPATYFASGKKFGLDFMFGSDHSDNLALPVSLNDECLTPQGLPTCILDSGPDTLRKWDATREQAAAATTPSFTALRGFEWTSDRFGHIDVYGSSEYANAKLDGGYLDLSLFYAWLGRHRDGLATFNHPGAKKLSDSDPGFNWNDFAHVDAVDDQFVGLEVFNDKDEYGVRWYTHALDKGWHVGAVGAEDLGHRRSDDWGGPRWAKTVILATANTPAALRAALKARRFYAVRETPLRMSFTVDRQMMGSRLTRNPGARLDIRARSADPALTVELLTSGGTVVASGHKRVALKRAASAKERYYLVRLKRGDKPVAYSSPVWVAAGAR